MLVTIVRAGGLAGFARRTELDSAALPADAVAMLRDLVERLRGTSTSLAAGPDELRYELIVVDDDSTWNIRTTEQGLSEPERLLIEFVDGCTERVDSLDPI
jgi:hypothetical protein